MTTAIILTGEAAETQILPIAIAEGSIQILQGPTGITIVEPAGAQIVMLHKAQDHIHHAPQAAQGLQVEV